MTEMLLLVLLGIVAICYGSENRRIRKEMKDRSL